MKCKEHDYGYEDLPIEGLKPPSNNCNICWAIYTLNNGNGEIASYNIDILEDAFTEFNAFLEYSF